MNELDQILSLEFKKEVADRYFGFRKLIEDDIKAYNEQLLVSFRHLEQTIGLDLIRLYILLKHPNLIEKFFKLTGLEDNIFFDPYLLESPTIKKRVFYGYHSKGLTKRKRFTHLFLQIYKELDQYLESYDYTLQKLISEQETITEEIKLFYKNNDLSSILGFFRNLDSGGSAPSVAATGETQAEGDARLARKMRVQQPQAVDKILPTMKPLKSFKSIKSPLIQLIHQAFEQQGRPDIQHLCN